eukprot:83897-Pleurochrysis_carterae.AAC.3
MFHVQRRSSHKAPPPRRRRSSSERRSRQRGMRGDEQYGAGGKGEGAHGRLRAVGVHIRRRSRIDQSGPRGLARRFLFVRAHDHGDLSARSRSL